ncbi:MAG: hypothetical protein M3071_09340 [Actinomycetota bacterium]|nr:hypothetical protein [Actinomycetota bacterium]
MLTHHGGYTTPHALINEVTPAEWVAVGLSTIGIIAAILSEHRRQPQEHTSILVGVQETHAA